MLDTSQVQVQVQTYPCDDDSSDNGLNGIDIDAIKVKLEYPPVKIDAAETPTGKTVVTKFNYLVAYGDERFKIEIEETTTTPITKAQSLKCATETPSSHHTNFECIICKYNAESNGQLLRHIRSHTKDELFKCAECLKVYSEKRTLQRHIQSHPVYLGKTTHLSSTMYDCNLCQYTSKHKENLRKHMRSHGDGKSYQCHMCPDKKYRHSSGLAIHLRMHSGERHFECSLCIKKFASSYHRYRHEVTHSNKRPFLCNLCPSSFILKTYLNSHMKKHAMAKSMVKRFECGECMKTFTTPFGLKIHQKTAHSDLKPFECTVCTKTFARQQYLSTHMNRHTGIRPFSCERCSKTFSRKDCLILHMRIHTGEKPFRCKYCSKSFSQKNNLKTHQRLYCVCIGLQNNLNEMNVSKSDETK